MPSDLPAVAARLGAVLLVVPAVVDTLGPPDVAVIGVATLVVVALWFARPGAPRLVALGALGTVGGVAALVALADATTTADVAGATAHVVVTIAGLALLAPLLAAGRPPRAVVAPAATRGLGRNRAHRPDPFRRAGGPG